MSELTAPLPHSLITPIGHNLTVIYAGGPFSPASQTQVIEGEGLPIEGKPVQCRQFTVTHSSNPQDHRHRRCNEKIPSYLEGYCECDGRHVPYRASSSGSLLTCLDYRLHRVYSMIYRVVWTHRKRRFNS